MKNLNSYNNLDRFLSAYQKYIYCANDNAPENYLCLFKRCNTWLSLYKKDIKKGIS